MAGPEPAASIASAAQRIERRELSSAELVDDCLSRIAAQNDILHGFITVDAEGARRAARAADEEIAAGRRRGPLHGVPVGLKDIIETEGLRTTAHSHLYRDFVPSRDAHVVKRLRDAGAIVIGKLATHEFAIGPPDPAAPFPAARNPWNPDHSPGGSSSGCGTAVAARQVLGAIGTDTGGSIRIPASFCGLVGMKPTSGLVGRSGIMPLSTTLDVCGPISGAVADNALMLQAIAGHDPADPESANRIVGDFGERIGMSLSGVKIGVLPQIHERDAPASADVMSGFEDARRILVGLGAEFVEAKLPDLWEMESCFTLIAFAESFEVHRERLADRRDLYGQATWMRLAIGAFVSAADYLRAMRERHKLRLRAAMAMQGLSALLTVGAQRAAPRFDQASDLYGPWAKRNSMMSFNLLGLPALAVPSGLSTQGLPVAIQLVGHPFDEATLYGIGHAFEEARGELAPLPRPAPGAE